MEVNAVALNPDLVIGKDQAIERMGQIASQARDAGKSNFHKQIQLVRNYAHSLCTNYRNCKKEDWCWFCRSGANGILYRGDVCLDCALLDDDIRLDHKTKLVQISTRSQPAITL